MARVTAGPVHSSAAVHSLAPTPLSIGRHTARGSSWNAHTAAPSRTASSRSSCQLQTVRQRQRLQCRCSANPSMGATFGECQRRYVYSTKLPVEVNDTTKYNVFTIPAYTDESLTSSKQISLLIMFFSHPPFISLHPTNKEARSSIYAFVDL